MKRVSMQEQVDRRADSIQAPWWASLSFCHLGCCSGGSVSAEEARFKGEVGEARPIEFRVDA